MSNKCVTSNDELIVDIFIHSIILVIILSGVFWLLIAPLEKKNFNKEIDSQAKTSINQYVTENKKILQLTPDKLTEVTDKLDLLSRFYESDDEVTKTYNKWLLRVNIVVIVFMIITFLLLLLILKYNCGKCIPVMTIFSENIALFICIGIIEYLFFMNIATKYVPVKPSYIVTRTIADIKKQFSST